MQPPTHEGSITSRNTYERRAKIEDWADAQPYDPIYEDQEVRRPIYVRRTKETSSSEYPMQQVIPSIEITEPSPTPRRSSSNHRPPFVREATDGGTEVQEMTFSPRQADNFDGPGSDWLRDDVSHKTDTTIEIERETGNVDSFGGGRHVVFRSVESFAPTPRQAWVEQNESWGIDDYGYGDEEDLTSHPEHYNRHDGSYTL